jgi:hypothetical protein
MIAISRERLESMTDRRFRKVCRDFVVTMHERRRFTEDDLTFNESALAAALAAERKRRGIQLSLFD